MKIVGHISVLNEGAANGELRVEGRNETTTVYTADLVAANNSDESRHEAAVSDRPTASRHGHGRD